MSGALVTVRHYEIAVENHRLCSPVVERVGIHVDAEITYEPGQTREALEAVDRLADDLRRQIADAAESSPAPDDLEVHP